ncbi:DUF6302 family protein [Streptomyces albipurpureus]|uniref:DUF6302 family protein n=1 Tax=Streptomyces albipurpureus TaxID=2897419 RepID=A0ABT0UWK7_9ACTN|nr:DUF6302 family protein [Streptomyces sp. CWNU-1]MCM2392020.1 DUF6302 family protein [Streptomyces sp. CWNU-1]
MAYDYEFMLGRLADPLLLASSVALCVFRAPLLAIPVGGSRLGGVLEAATREIGYGIVGALSGRLNFPDVRLRFADSGREGFVVEWGATCPPWVSRVARDRFYGLTAQGHGPVSAKDAVVLDAVAQGVSARTLSDCGLFPNVREAQRGVALLGRALTSGRGVRWTRIVHLAAARRLVAIHSSPPVEMPLWQLDLLKAWAAGWSLERYADQAGLQPEQAQELRQLVLGSLEARCEEHAVLRSHERGLLGPHAPPWTSVAGPRGNERQAGRGP